MVQAEREPPAREKRDGLFFDLGRGRAALFARRARRLRGGCVRRAWVGRVLAGGRGWCVGCGGGFCVHRGRGAACEGKRAGRAVVSPSPRRRARGERVRPSRGVLGRAGEPRPRGHYLVARDRAKTRVLRVGHIPGLPGFVTLLLSPRRRLRRRSLRRPLRPCPCGGDRGAGHWGRAASPLRARRGAGPTVGTRRA